MGQTTLFLFAFNAILVYNKMNYMLVQENKEKGEMMLAEMKEIILIIEEFCIDTCIAPGGNLSCQDIEEKTHEKKQRRIRRDAS